MFMGLSMGTAEGSAYEKNYFGVYGYFTDVYRWYGDKSGQGINRDGTEGRNVCGDDSGCSH